MKVLKKLLKEADKSVEKIIVQVFSNTNKELGIPEAVTLGLFEDLVRKIQTLIHLVEHDKDTSIDMTLRSIFESYTYLIALISEENSLLARSYLMSYKRKNILLYDTITENSKKGDKIRQYLGVDIKDVEIHSELVNLTDLSNEFANVLSKRKMKDKWYNIDGKTNNFEQLCTKLKLQAEYELIYRILSSEVHSSDVMKRWRFKKDEVQLLEKTTDSTMHINASGLFLLSAIRKLYEFYNLKNELLKFDISLRINQLNKKY